MSHKGKKCIYCERNPSTRAGDHVPPEGLFTRPFPSNLITVPACEGCNQRFSSDDQYFLSVVGSMQGVDNSDAFRQLARRNVRAVSKSEATGFRKRIKNEILPLPNGDASYVRSLDLNRCYAVIARISQSLTWHHFAITPKATRAVITDHLGNRFEHCEEGTEKSSDWKHAATGIFSRVFFEGLYCSIGHSAFNYRYLADFPNSFYWYFSFYGRFSTLAIVTSKHPSDSPTSPPTPEALHP